MKFCVKLRRWERTWLKPERQFARPVTFTQLWTSAGSLSGGTLRCRLCLSRNHLTVWNNSTNQMKQLSVNNFHLDILAFTRSGCRVCSDSLLHLRNQDDWSEAAVKLLDWKNRTGPRSTKGRRGEAQQREVGTGIPRTKENSTWEMTLCTCYKPAKIWLYTGKIMKIIAFF